MLSQRMSIAASSHRCDERLQYVDTIHTPRGGRGMTTNLSLATEADSAVSGSRPVAAFAWLAARTREWGILAAVCLAGVALVGRGIANEGGVSLDGDMPHYLLNGAFLHDFLTDLPLRAPLEYAEHYYVRYPAMTLGHHPVVPALAELPFFAVFGISVFAARLATLATFLLLLVFWFKLLREIYDTPTALFASILFISSPGVVPLFQVALSEPYVLSLIVLSVYFMHRYCVLERTRDLVAFSVCVVGSVYAKQLAVFMFPLYAFQFLRAFGLRGLLRRSTLFTIAAIGGCLVPLVAVTMKYSHWNVRVITEFVHLQDRTSAAVSFQFARWLWGGQFGMSWPLLVLAGIALIAALFRRDRRALLFAVWASSVYLGVIAVGVPNDRFGCYWLLPFCALAATALQVSATPFKRTVLVIALAATGGYQLWAGIRSAHVPVIAGLRPAGATGYEEAAQYVTEHPLGDTVLYSAAVDTGYFVFFVRKHDHDRKAIVLRADKVLTTSLMAIPDYQRRISRRDEILPMMRRLGVGYVVIEDRLYADGPLRWLQQTLDTPDFELKRRIPIASTDLRLRDATLSIFEFRQRTPAEVDAKVSIGVPLMNGGIEVRLADLTRRDR